MKMEMKRKDEKRKGGERGERKKSPTVINSSRKKIKMIKMIGLMLASTFIKFT
jgi:hypothetical protein